MLYSHTYLHEVSTGKKNKNKKQQLYENDNDVESNKKY